MKNSICPAHPCKGPYHPNYKNTEFAFSGLSKREWFAGMALQGLLAHHGADGEKIAGFECQHAVAYADLILKELSK